MTTPPLGRFSCYLRTAERAAVATAVSVAISPSYCAGQMERALPHFDAALRLSPRSPMHWVTLMIKGNALRSLGRHDEAIAHCRQACQFPEVGFLPFMHLAAALAEAGQKSATRAATEKTVQLQPALSIGFIRSHFVGMHENSLQSLLDSLRKAGVPD